MNDALLQFLGIARRANQLSLGHDAALNTLLRKKAQLCMLSSDASARLEKECKHAMESVHKEIPIIKLPYTMSHLYKAIGFKAGVFTINDEGFAKRVQELHNSRTGEEFLL